MLFVSLYLIERLDLGMYITLHQIYIFFRMEQMVASYSSIVIKRISLFIAITSYKGFIDRPIVTVGLLLSIA